MRMHHSTAVEADQLTPLDVPGDEQALPLVSAGVHVPHFCASHLRLVAHVLLISQEFIYLTRTVFISKGSACVGGRP